ncbi:hypothetical protein TrRE_jg8593 [Triparma retinervis]|uniref:J domain-containing protein n=1 Tax=Triparma retinervis TaxID=2557542 RepID=A0A9W7EBW9_9STRA|nr:hypothetical protein TrRE_jg8593 [Triparma retinervis]
MDLPKAYAILSLPLNSTLREIRTRYKTLALQLHPDRRAPKDAPQPSFTFMDVHSAYHLLTSTGGEIVYAPKPDFGKVDTSSLSNSLHVLSPSKLEIIHTFSSEHDKEELYCCCFVGSNFVATAGRMGAVYVYDWVDLKCVKTLVAETEITSHLESETVLRLLEVEVEGRYWLLEGGYQGLRVWNLDWINRKKIE